MLPKKYRLQQVRDFARLYKRGKSFGTPLFVIKYLKNELNNPRFAFVVSNKITKKAFLRNKIKRQLRAIVHPEGDTLRVQFYDIIIIARSKILTQKFATLQEELTKALKKLKLLI